MCLYVYVCVCVCMCMYVYICVCMCMCMYVYVCVCVCLCIMYVCMCVCMYVCMHACMYVCMYECMCVCRYVCVCTSVCTTYVSTYVGMCRKMASCCFQMHFAGYVPLIVDMTWCPFTIYSSVRVLSSGFNVWALQHGLNHHGNGHDPVIHLAHCHSFFWGFKALIGDTAG